jgi:hypothetical protein
MGREVYKDAGEAGKRISMQNSPGQAVGSSLNSLKVESTGGF